MKTLLIITGIFLFFTMNAENEIVLKSRTKKVTVFLNSAQVTRTADFNASTGIQDVIFEGVSPYINPKSLQATGKGDYTILDVQYRIQQPQYKEPVYQSLPDKIVRSIELLNDSLTQVSFDLENIANKKEVLSLEKKVLLGNKFMQGNADTIPELKLAMEYLRKQLNDINNSLNDIKRQEYQIISKKTKMEKRLSDLSNYNTQQNPVVQELPVHQVVVTIQTKAPITGTISVSYMAQNAGWAPAYDIRASSVGQPVKLVQKANVYQNTGENWQNVKLTLSTITPSTGISKPVLPIFYLGYYNYNTRPVSYNKRESEKENRALAGSITLNEIQLDAYTSANYTQTNETMTNVEYEIDLSYNIPSDGKSHLIAVKEYDLKAEFVHYLVPEMSKNAFLMAKITDWSNLDLIPAMANIYFEGTYVGETQLATGVISDTLELALGTDRSVIIERKKGKDEQKNALIGNNVIKTVTYTLNIKNNKSSGINLVIEDRLPVTQDPSIKVEKGNISGADYNEQTGFLTWKSKVNSMQSKTINFSYTVEFDKTRPLANL
jgi:uncharacterized protein (TIGR02231 family)